MADFSRETREHWLKQHFSKNEVAKSGYSIFSPSQESLHAANGHIRESRRTCQVVREAYADMP